MDHVFSSLPGWCSPAKRQYLTDWVRTYQPKTLVEIGVYGGSSLLPVAVEAKVYGGKVYGIDPWSIPAALEGMEKTANVEWWRKHSALQSVKQEFLQARNELGLVGTVEVLQMTSREAVNRFADASIDYLSIDGNHGPPAVEDGQLYHPKLANGALIACDDTDWEEGGVFYVRQMIDWLRDNGCSFLSIVDGCTMLQRD